MWDYITPRNLIDMQRVAAWQKMGEQARELLAEGYASDADRALDEMVERRRRWLEEAA